MNSRRASLRMPIKSLFGTLDREGRHSAPPLGGIIPTVGPFWARSEVPIKSRSSPVRLRQPYGATQKAVQPTSNPPSPPDHQLARRKPCTSNYETEPSRI